MSQENEDESFEIENENRQRFKFNRKEEKNGMIEMEEAE